VAQAFELGGAPLGFGFSKGAASDVHSKSASTLAEIVGLFLLPSNF
jgi:hypothetical protein